MSDVCWYCGGEGGWHDCGEDSCSCLVKELNEVCHYCGGTGIGDEFLDDDGEEDEG